MIFLLFIQVRSTHPSPTSKLVPIDSFETPSMGTEIYWAKIFITLSIGVTCGLLAKKLKVPAGYMIGAFVGVSAFNVSFEFAYLPGETKTLVQMIAGAFVGCTLNKRELSQAKKYWGSFALLLLMFLLLNMMLGAAIWKFSSLDLVTSLMSAVPGGINDTPIVAAAMGADAPVVTVMQLIRQILGIFIFPLIIGGIFKSQNENVKNMSPLSVKAKKKNSKELQKTLVTLAVAIGAGLLGRISGIPGMTFTASILGIVILKLGLDFAFIPKEIKKLCQLLAGCFLGTLLTAQEFFRLHEVFLPVLILILGYSINCLLTGYLEHKLFKFSKPESFLMACPAGASDMALILEELRIKSTTVVTMQVLRAAFVMALFPQVINVICYVLQGG